MLPELEKQARASVLRTIASAMGYAGMQYDRQHVANLQAEAQQMNELARALEARRMYSAVTGSIDKSAEAIANRLLEGWLVGCTRKPFPL